MLAIFFVGFVVIEAMVAENRFTLQIDKLLGEPNGLLLQFLKFPFQQQWSTHWPLTVSILPFHIQCSHFEKISSILPSGGSQKNYLKEEFSIFFHWICFVSLKDQNAAA